MSGSFSLKEESKLVSGYGIVSLLPVLLVMLTAVITRRIVEPILFGSLIGYLILYKGSFLYQFLYGAVSIISEYSWFILVFGLFGMVITLLEKSGGAIAFADFGQRIAKTRTSSLLITWGLGLLVFMDDYLNILSIGTAMRSVTDKHKVAREFLAYGINSTAAAICVLVPFSSWAILMMSIYESLGVQVSGSSYTAYVHTIPYLFYPWVTLLLVPSFALKVIPSFGPMKRAQLRADTGELFLGDPLQKEERDEIITSMWNFIIPMVAVISTTLYSNDILIGMAIGFISCFLLYLPQGIMTFGEFFDHSLEGFKGMLLVTSIVLSAFLLQRANQELGLTEYVITIAEPLIKGQFLPVVAFLLCSLMASFTGSFWGTMAIASPILIPLAYSLQVDPLIVGGAIVSAGVFGSHTCFFGDAVTLIAWVTGITNKDYVKTAIPLIILPTMIAILLFLIFGFLLYFK